MADVIKKTANAKGIYEIRRSVNTPDFPAGTWQAFTAAGVASLISGAVPEKYWKPDAGNVIEKTDQEKADTDKPAALSEVDANTRSLALADLDATYDTANGSVGATAKAAINAATTPDEVTTAKALDTR